MTSTRASIPTLGGVLVIAVNNFIEQYLDVLIAGRNPTSSGSHHDIYCG